MQDRFRKMLFGMSTTPAFFARNLWCGKKIVPFKAVCYGRFVVEPLSARYVAKAENLYASLNNGACLGFQKAAMLRLSGSRFCLVARESSRDELVGMAVYYFNARDRRESTVHEGYIGLREHVRGCGLGIFMRRHALENFSRSGFKGMSSRISISNLPSLLGNRKLGFVPVETYFDPSMGELRHYLVCDFRRNGSPFDKTNGMVH